MLLSPPLAATLELIVEKLPPLHIVSPVLEIVPAVNALRSVATHEPLDVVAEAHVPSCAFLVYVPAELGV